MFKYDTLLMNQLLDQCLASNFNASILTSSFKIHKFCSPSGSLIHLILENEMVSKK
jgi:hypothetical protein